MFDPVVNTQAFQEKYYSKVERNSPGTNCWLWIGKKDGCGYGMIRAGKKGSARAHRVGYSMVHGDIPAGMCVCHRCDNPGCVNPDHLFLGTHKENMIDRGTKGRTSKGADRPGAKMDPHSVMEARLRYTFSGITAVELAEDYGISQQQMLSTLEGKTWKSVNHPPVSREVFISKRGYGNHRDHWKWDVSLGPSNPCTCVLDA